MRKRLRGRREGGGGKEGEEEEEKEKGKSFYLLPPPLLTFTPQWAEPAICWWTRSLTPDVSVCPPCDVTEGIQLWVLIVTVVAESLAF